MFIFELCSVYLVEYTYTQSKFNENFDVNVSACSSPLLACFVQDNKPHPLHVNSPIHVKV